MRVRVIGLGTRFGDDASGLLVAEGLAESLAESGLEAVSCGRPVDLLEALDGAEAAVLVDATRSGLEPGTVHEPAPEALCEARPVSSHGLGVAEALALARALGRLPERLAIVGIEAERTEGEELSAAVRASLLEARERVLARCRAFAMPDRALSPPWAG